MTDETTKTSKPGCCVDRESGTPRGCQPHTCMMLPQGESCGTCVHSRKCIAIFGMTAEDTSCSFFPRRFRRAEDAQQTSEVPGA